ncbi:putative transposase [Neisseria meningitidis 98002]|nr:putative transposase [Neisseria meningitidis 98002]
MRKACRNRPLSETQTKRNRYLSKTRYVVEQASVRCTVIPLCAGSLFRTD